MTLMMDSDQTFSGLIANKVAKLGMSAGIAKMEIDDENA